MDDSCTIMDILKELESNNSRLFKLETLSQNKHNDLLKSVLKAALDPYTQYYIRKIPEYYDKEFRKDLNWALTKLEDLSSRKVTGNEAIEFLKNVLGRVNACDAEVVKRIIQKDLKCGVSIATVNKVFGKDFIEKYPCMLASAYNEKNFKNIKYPALVQIKMDGMRANIIITNEGNVEVRSRNGKHIELFGLFDDYVRGIFHKPPSLENLEHYRGAVIDGELIVLGDNGEVLDRKTGNGILNKAVRGTITQEEASRVRMVAWDMIPLEDFKTGKCVIPYFDRVAVFVDRMNDVYNTQKEHLIEIIDTIPVDTFKEAEELFNDALASGEEGVIVKNGDAPWEDKRSKYQVKMKAELEADLMVESIIEGTGKYEGMIGSVTCTTKDKTVQVNVGSGFTDEDRKMNPDDIIGKIISVKYNEKIRDKNSDTWSLFLPIFQEVRLDKTEADNL